MLGFAGTVDDAAHHRDVETFDAGIARLPFRHFVADEVLDAARQFLERGRGGAAAAGARSDQRHEGAEAHGLEQFLRHLHLAGAVAAGLRRQRDADGVADALLQQDAERRGRGDDALRAHAGLGEAEMDRVIRPRGEILVDRDQVLHRRDLGRQDDAVLRQADLLGARRRGQRRLHHRLTHHRAGVARIGEPGVLLHQMRQQFLIERSPVGADAHRLAESDREFDDVGELLVALVLEADIARIDAVLVERLGAGRMIGEQLVADIVEVADQRHGDAALAQAVADMGHGGGGLVAVDGDADQFRSRPRQRGDLLHRARDVRGVGIGHRLHDDRRTAPDGHVADLDLGGGVAGLGPGDIGRLGLFKRVHGVSNIRFSGLSATDQWRAAPGG